MTSLATRADPAAKSTAAAITLIGGGRT